MSKQIEVFFDGLAKGWDARESHTNEEKKELLSYVGIKPGDDVLDLACGTGVVTALIHNLSQTDVIALDLSNEMILVAKDKYKEQPWAHFFVGDFLDFEINKKFDKIVMYNAFPHFLDVPSLAKKAAELLKEHGTFAILHSLSKIELHNHHAGVSNDISRDLDDLTVEAAKFDEYFSSKQIMDKEHSLAIILTKK